MVTFYVDTPRAFATLGGGGGSDDALPPLLKNTVPLLPIIFISKFITNI